MNNEERLKLEKKIKQLIETIKISIVKSEDFESALKRALNEFTIFIFKIPVKQINDFKEIMNNLVKDDLN